MTYEVMTYIPKFNSFNTLVLCWSNSEKLRTYHVLVRLTLSLQPNRKEWDWESVLPGPKPFHHFTHHWLIHSRPWNSEIPRGIELLAWMDLWIGRMTHAWPLTGWVSPTPWWLVSHSTVSFGLLFPPTHQSSKADCEPQGHSSHLPNTFKESVI